MSAARFLVLIKKYDSKWILAGEPQLYSSGRGRAAQVLGDMTHASRPGFRDNASTACSNGEVQFASADRSARRSLLHRHPAAGVGGYIDRRPKRTNQASKTVPWSTGFNCGRKPMPSVPSWVRSPVGDFFCSCSLRFLL